MPINPEKQRIVLLVRQILKRSQLSVAEMVTKMERYAGGKISEDQFENKFTLRIERRPNITRTELMALLRAATDDLPPSWRCQASEALELALNAGMPSLLPEIQTLFPLTELVSAFQTQLPLAFSGMLKLTPFPHPATPLIGREHEIALVGQRLRQQRLLTLTGPGGCGKTRLAIHVAAEQRHFFADGVAFIALADLNTPELVPAALAHALGMAATPEQAWQQQLTSVLATRHMLLVLDNFEHLLAAAPLLDALVENCPQLHFLVTSRIALRLAEEHVLMLPPLALPSSPTLPLHELALAPAVALFCERAQAVRPGFALTAANSEDVTAICTVLVGMPLPLVLAAACLHQFTPAQLRTHLASQDQRLALDLLIAPRMASDLPSRHVTLRATLEWSYRLLTPSAQGLLCRIAVFSGGCSAEALSAIWQAAGAVPLRLPTDDLTLLLDHHLVTIEQVEGLPLRYQMRATVREYAWQRLEARGELVLRCQEHAHYYLGFAHEAAQLIRGAEQALWLRRLEHEQANLRAALVWFLHQAQHELALELCAQLELFWYWGGHLEEGVTWLRRALEQGHSLPTRTIAKALDELAGFEWARGFAHEAERLASQSLTLWRELDDPQGIAEALNTLGLAAEAQSNFARSMAWHNESLALRRQLGYLPSIVVALNNLGDAEHAAGTQWYSHAHRHFQESLQLTRQLGDQLGFADTLISLSSLALRQEDYPLARTYLHESLYAFQQFGNKLRIAYAFEQLADVALAQQEHQRAAYLCAAAANLRATLHVQPPPMEVAAIARRITTLGQCFDAQHFATLWATGMQWNLDAALAYALAKDDSTAER